MMLEVGMVVIFKEKSGGNNQEEAQKGLLGLASAPFLNLGCSYLSKFAL